MKSYEYKKMIEQLLDNSLAITDFTIFYDKTFLSEPEVMEKELFDILENLWEAVEAYSPLWKVEEFDENHISEKTLRKEAIIAVDLLEKYIKTHSQSL